VEAELVGDLADEHLVGLEALGGVAHLQAQDVLPGALVAKRLNSRQM